MSRSRPALLLIMALGAAACGGTGSARRTEEISMEWKGAFCRVDKATHRVVRTAEEWRALWKELGAEAPEADLDSHFAVAVFLGARNTGGYGVDFGEPSEGPSEVMIPYRVMTPGDMLVIQAFTQPYGVRLYPSTSKAVRVEVLGE